MNRCPRIYYPDRLNLEVLNLLDERASHYLATVLRVKSGQKLVLFDGKNPQEYQAEVVSIEKKKVQIKILNVQAKQLESPLKIFLGQAISRGERMDYTLQKSVELGVYEITPLFTERCGVDLKGERLEKRGAHWQQVVIAACEQSGRCYVPLVTAPLTLDQWLQQLKVELALVADPESPCTINQIKADIKTVALLCGPEGGLSEAELNLAGRYDLQSFSMGPRILRTETAALTAISLMQQHWGDF